MPYPMIKSCWPYILRVSFHGVCFSCFGDNFNNKTIPYWRFSSTIQILIIKSHWNVITNSKKRYITDLSNVIPFTIEKEWLCHTANYTFEKITSSKAEHKVKNTEKRVSKISVIENIPLRGIIFQNLLLSLASHWLFCPPLFHH